jgi:hypothetical protein
MKSSSRKLRYLETTNDLLMTGHGDGTVDDSEWPIEEIRWTIVVDYLNNIV